MPAVRDLPRRHAAGDRHAPPDVARRAGRINGIGEAKLARHGQAVLDTLAEVSPVATGQVRIRVPFGSYSAPGATSASTHSPSTATAGGLDASTGR